MLLAARRFFSVGRPLLPHFVVPLSVWDLAASPWCFVAICSHVVPFGSARVGRLFDVLGCCLCVDFFPFLL